MALALDFMALLAAEQAAQRKRSAPATAAGSASAASESQAAAAAAATTTTTTMTTTSASVEAHPALGESSLRELAGVARGSGASGPAGETLASAPMQKVVVHNEFLSAACEADLLRCVLSPVYEASGRWVRLRGRRLLQFGGTPMPGPRLLGREPLPPWLGAVVDRLVATGAFPEDKRPNHVLVNAYGPGEGILPHTDGPLYFPCTATLSLGSDAVMGFAPRVPSELVGTPSQSHLEAAKSFDAGLARRSLVVFSDEAYTSALHDVAAVGEHRVTAKCLNAASLGWAEGSLIPRAPLRVSLTMRHVPAVEGATSPKAL